MIAQQPDVTVRLDDRIRLMSAILAATDWPDKAQARQPHGTHAHARATRRYLKDHSGHDAVRSLQNLIDQGAPLEAVYTFALCLNWPDLELQLDALPGWIPPNWLAHLRDFLRVTDLTSWWADEARPWQKSVEEASKIITGQGVTLKPFLRPFLGEITEDLLFLPNISYPTDQEIGIRLGNDLICIAPPRLAWGDSPPWPFDEDPVHIYRAMLTQFGRQLLVSYLRVHADRIAAARSTALPVSDQFRAMHPSWEEQFTALFVAAAVAIYLEDYVSKAEADAYVLMARKTQGMTILPGTISVLRRYLTEQETGRYTSLIDFLHIFPKQLRVAKRIVML
jgi:hypothetical protein